MKPFFKIMIKLSLSVLLGGGNFINFSKIYKIIH
jgi:hypothetical protein